MLKHLSKLLGSSSPPKPASIPGDNANLPIAPPNDGTDALRYPPYDRGFAATPLANVLHGQRDLIERINRTAGMSAEDFDTRCRPAIENLARYVHLLPVTSTEYFRGEGGLLRMSLEIGLYAMQQASAAVFPIAGGVDKRYLIHPKWCFATFLAGICSQLYRPATHMAVVSADGQQWPALLMPLSQWLDENKVDTYFVRWLDKANSVSGAAAAAFLVSHIAPPALLQWLNDENTVVLPALAAATAGGTDTHGNPIVGILAPTTTRVIDDDVRRNPVNYGHLTVGMHLEPHIINAMRHLVRTSVWVANKDGSLFWVGADGTYLDWARAAAEITDCLSRDNFTGIPTDPGLLANILLQSGIATRRNLNTPYWTIMHPDTGSIVEGNLKLVDPDFLFTDQAQYPEDRSNHLSVEDKPPVTVAAVKRPGKSAVAATKSEAVVDTNGPAQLDLLGGDPVPVPPSAAPPKASAVSKMAEPKLDLGAGKRDEPPPAMVVDAVATAAPTQGKRAASGKAKSQATAGAPAKEAAPSTPIVEIAQSPAIPSPVEAPPAAETSPAAVPTTEANPAAAEGIAPMEPLGATAEALLSELKPDSATILRTIVRAYRAETLVGQVLLLDHGIAISQQEMLAHGMHFKDLLEELWSKKWLWIDNKKPMRQLHPMKQGERDIRVLILTPKIGTQIFELEEKSSV